MKYIYKGTLNTIELIEKSSKDENKIVRKDVVLVKNKKYELPENNNKIKELVRQRKLVPVEDKEVKKSKGKGE